MVHLKDTIIYGEVQFETTSDNLTLINLPKVNNLPILLQEDISAELYSIITSYHNNTQSQLTQLQRKATIAGAST